jgi:hypothetical protein
MSCDLKKSQFVNRTYFFPQNTRILLENSEVLLLGTHMYQVLTIPSSKSLKELVQGTLYAGTELSQ